MAPRPFFVKFKPSVAADVVAYKIYVYPEGDPLLSDTPFIQIDAPFSVDENGKISVDLQQHMPTLDGSYTVSVTAIDDAGNESASLTGVTQVDFVVPDAPTELEFVKG